MKRCLGLDYVSRKVNMAKKKTIVLCLIVFVGLLNIVALNVISLMTRLSYYFNINDGELSLDGYRKPPNPTQITDILSKPMVKNNCHFSRISNAICTKQNRTLPMLDMETMEQEAVKCPIVKEILVRLIVT